MMEKKGIHVIGGVATLLVLINSIWLLGGGSSLNNPLILPFISSCGEIGIAAVLITMGYDSISFVESRKGKALQSNAELLAFTGSCVLVVLSIGVMNIMFERWQVIPEFNIASFVLRVVLSFVAGLYLKFMEEGDSDEKDTEQINSKKSIIVVISGVILLYLLTIRLSGSGSYDKYGILRKVFSLLIVVLIALIMYSFNRIIVKRSAFSNMIVVLSKISYAVLISHWIVIRFMLNHVPFLKVFFRRGIVRFLSLILISFAVGYVLWLLIKLFFEGDLKRKSIIIAFGIIVCVALFAYKANSKKGFHIEQLEEAGYKIENVHVSVKGLDRPYHFIWISDLHISIANKEVSESEMSNIITRENSLHVNDKGEKSHDVWISQLADLLDESNADGIFFGADIVDFCSEANVSCFKEKLDSLKTPYIYIRADHDYETSWLSRDVQEKCKSLQDTVCNNENVMYTEYDGFIVLAFNNSTSQLTEEGLKVVKSVFEKKKPIILLSHVPVASIVDESLSGSCKNAWRGLDLTWGENAVYKPNEVTGELLNYIYDKNSSVREILSGHLHYSWDGKVTDNVHEHVFSPAYKGYIGVITVDGE